MTIIKLIVTIGVVGPGLYLLRCRSLLAFGLLEVVVSAVVIYLAYYPPVVGLAASIGWWSWLSEPVSIVLGLYLMVRGFDNIEKGLPPSSRAKWRGWFYGKASQLP
jgi:hypothetical protein